MVCVLICFQIAPLLNAHDTRYSVRLSGGPLPQMGGTRARHFLHPLFEQLEPVGPVFETESPHRLSPSIA